MDTQRDGKEMGVPASLRPLRAALKVLDKAEKSEAQYLKKKKKI